MLSTFGDLLNFLNNFFFYSSITMSMFFLEHMRVKCLFLILEQVLWIQAILGILYKLFS